MPLGDALSSLMAAIPPMGRSAPDMASLAGASSLPGGGVSAPAPAGPRPGPGGGGSDIFAQAVNSRLSQAGSVGPQYFIYQLNQMKSVVAGMLPKALSRFPAQADRQLQNLLRAIDSTTKAFQEAAQHQAATAGGGQSIDFSGARIGAPTGLPTSV